MIDPKALVAKKVEAELFTTKEKKVRATVDLQSLLTHPGWIILERILKYNIDANAEVILDGGATKEQEDELRRDRLNLQYLKLLPTSLAKELTAQANYVEPNDDPYEPNNDPTLDKNE